MLFERIVSEGLAHNSYIVGSGGVAAVIDPRRDCGIYPAIARKNGLTISHIFETHRNEDYLTGSRDLASRTGAAIFHGSRLPFAYGTPVRGGDMFPFGSLVLEVMETPGHTEESISLVLRDREVGEEPLMVFCGDTLFAGDIARTDFYGEDRKAEMAEKIYDSIADRILLLGDGTIVCPAHGAGSICGGEIADHPFTTVGYERATNPLLRMGRAAFIAQRAGESPYYPPYFRQMERLNLAGPPLLRPDPLPPILPVPAVNELRKTGCQIVDIRSPTSFSAGHIPGSLSVWRDGLASFMGWFLDYERPVVLVDDFNLAIGDVAAQFARLGYDNLTGILAGGFPLWTKAGQEIATIPSCPVLQLKERLETGPLFLLDVRDIRNRRSAGHIRGSLHIYVGELPLRWREVPQDRPVYVYCDAGYKGGMAASFLAMKGYQNVTNVLGGFTGWKQAGFPVETAVHPPPGGN